VWPLAVIFVLLVLYNCSTPEVVQHVPSGIKEGRPDQCNRASCWDEKKGRYISSQEWDKKQRMLER
jgi:hypothetical protein